MKGTNPFQVLASCIEYTNAIESDDPNTYISYLPVHQVIDIYIHSFVIVYASKLNQLQTMER